MRHSNSRKPQPPRHGQIRVASMKLHHAKAQIRIMAESAAEVREYGGHEATSYDSRGAMSPGGAGGADYVTNSVNDTPYPDFTGSGY